MKQVGNVTADSELTYEYGVRKVSAPPAPPPGDKVTNEGDDVKTKGKERV